MTAPDLGGKQRSGGTEKWIKLFVTDRDLGGGEGGEEGDSTSLSRCHCYEWVPHELHRQVDEIVRDRERCGGETGPAHFHAIYRNGCCKEDTRI